MLLLITAAIPLAYYVLSSIMSDTGIVKCRKGDISVNTNLGNIRLPHVTLPSYDWDIHLFSGKSGFSEQDGLHDSGVLGGFKSIRPHMFRNIMLLEYMYPEQLGENVKYVINSPFDDVCYVKSLEKGKLIDYRAINRDFQHKIEEM